MNEKWVRQQLERRGYILFRLNTRDEKKYYVAENKPHTLSEIIKEYALEPKRSEFAPAFSIKFFDTNPLDTKFLDTNLNTNLLDTNASATSDHKIKTVKAKIIE